MALERKPLAGRVLGIQPSATLAISAKAKQLKAEGKDVVGFAAGEPDFDTPEYIRKAGCEAIETGMTRYTPAAGSIELRRAVVEKFKKENGLEYAESCVVVSNGAKHSIFNTVLSLVDEGDEVIVPSPYWVSYPEMVRAAGGTPVFVKGEQDNGFKVKAEDVEKAITGKTKLIIINSPSNPTGAVYSKDELTALAGVIVKHSIYCISDEIYEQLVYDGVSHHSIASLSPEMEDLTVVVNGCSKAFAMTGWRIGYLAGPKEVVSAVARLQSHSTSAPSAMSQHAARIALERESGEVEEMRKEFEQRRDLMLDKLRSCPGITCTKPGGAFYLFPNVSANYGRSIGGIEVTDSMSFAKACLECALVAVIPGLPFGADECVRMSYATSREEIERGTERLAELLA